MKSFLVAALLALLPISALAAAVPLTPFSQARTLQPGETWISPYTAATGDRFQLDVSFTGTGINSGADLALVRYGINAATQAYSSISTSPGGAALGTGFANDRAVNTAFSIVYTLDKAATREVSVTFSGLTSAVSVPEIGAEGAAVALLLVLGSLAAVGGTRRREAA